MTKEQFIDWARKELAKDFKGNMLSSKPFTLKGQAITIRELLEKEFDKNGEKYAKQFLEKLISGLTGSF